ncbi:hypothetical protein WJX72_002147 [[Myrmecia] bisecta]|uniref:Uncharacterized protein n=1 Tax=[Myrmecia] bisecta TaxID=41462 RepID=A0AAW1Q799_9CHLO
MARTHVPDLTPLAGLTALRELDLSELEVVHYLRGVTALTRLTALEMLTIDGLNEVEKDMLRSAFPLAYSVSSDDDDGYSSMSDICGGQDTNEAGAKAGRRLGGPSC